MNEKPKRIKLTLEQKANRNRGYRMTGIEKAGIVALLESGKGVRQVARETGRTPSTISRISRGKGVPIEPEQVAQIKMHLSGKLYKRADESVDLMGDGRLDEMTAYQLAGITKHTVETARLMDNESTTNLSVTARMMQLKHLASEDRQLLLKFAKSKLLPAGGSD
ncbi:MAG: hypothetical protein C0407_18630 [Desulfobacca sp.]|nr:hypothetical protein [Desulfobacca sp.]